MQTLGLLFYLKKSKTTTGGTAPLYLRITVGKQRTEVASKRLVKPERWHAAAQKVMGNTEEVKAVNAYLKQLEQQVFDAFQQLSQEGRLITAVTLKNKLAGKEVPYRSLVSIFEDHNRQVAALVGQGFAPGTLERYRTSLKHTVDFLQWQYRKKDVDIREIDHAFITSYEFYLRSERHCNNNSAVKYIKNFKKIMRICMANGWLTRDPFLHYKSKVKEVHKDFLSEEELQTMTAKVFDNERLCQVRDIFLFCCYTGLAYADIKKLSHAEISTGMDGEKWIFTNRKKTDTTSRIPLLPTSLEIIRRYQDHPQCSRSGKVLPVLSNQKMNAYLKEISDACGIQKHLTFHIARHTFATTVTLNNGVPIETVAKMLGHKTLRMTQHYAKLLDKKVSEDMQLLKQKLGKDKGNAASSHG